MSIIGVRYHLANTLHANRFPVFLAQAHNINVNRKYVAVKIVPFSIPEYQNLCIGEKIAIIRHEANLTQDGPANQTKNNRTL